MGFHPISIRVLGNWFQTSRFHFIAIGEKVFWCGNIFSHRDRVPQNFFNAYLSGGEWWTVPLAVLLAVPMYANAALHLVPVEKPAPQRPFTVRVYE